MMSWTPMTTVPQPVEQPSYGSVGARIVTLRRADAYFSTASCSSAAPCWQPGSSEGAEMPERVPYAPSTVTVPYPSSVEAMPWQKAADKGL